MSGFLVLPEYILNVSSARLGRGVFTGAQMAAMHLGSGVVCCALVSTIHLKESLSPLQMCGFGLMLISVALIKTKS